MPGRRNWWLDRAGRFSRYTNPQGGAPAYGVSMDVATAQWDDPTQFDALVDDEQASLNQTVLDSARALGESGGEGWGSVVWQTLASTGMLAQASVTEDELNAAMQEGAEAAAEDSGNWFTDATGQVGDFVGGAKDLAQSGIEMVPGGEQALDATGTAYHYSPLGRAAHLAMASSQKFNEGVSTVLVSSAVAEDQGGNVFEQLYHTFTPDTLSRAHDIVEANHLSMGEAAVANTLSFGQTNNIVTDQQRLENLKRNSGWFNAAGLAADIALTWKADPLVLAGHAAGYARAFRRGDILGDAPARALQKDIIGSATRAEAEAKVLQQTSLTDRLYANRGLTLWDRLEDMRSASKSQPFGEFVNNATFHRNVNGTVMASLIKEADDAEWSVLKRSLVGDEAAVAELQSMRGEITTKIDALNDFKLKPAQDELDALLAKKSEMELEDWYVQLGAPGKAEADRRVLSSAADDWLDTPIDQATTRVQELKDKLSTFTTHDDWYNRALAGVGQEKSALVSSGGEANVVFGGLESVGKAGSKTLGSRFLDSGFTRADRDRGKKWRDENPTTTTWQHDWLSPVSTLTKIPRSWFQKNNLLVNFHETDRSMESLGRFFDEYDSITGTSDMARRSTVLESYSKLMTEGDREAFVLKLQEELGRGVGKKYGLDDGMLRTLLQKVSEKHDQGWRRLTTGHYSSVEMPDGSLAGMFEWATDKGLHRVAMPLSTAELKNSRRLLNLRDLDFAIRRHKDILQEMSKSAEWQTRLHGKAIATRRYAADVSFAAMEGFNHLWKPLALISLRWPLRVIGDENTRWSLLGLQGMAREASSGSLNFMYNQGVRAYQYGRKKERARIVKSGSLSEDAVSPRMYDAVDPKMAGNPAGQMPIDVADLDNIDTARFDQLAMQATRRDAEFRDSVVARAGGEQRPRTREAQQFEDRVTELERTGGGAMIDPLTGKALNKGWATSVYPGRVRTLGEKPNADDYRMFADRNKDVLANKHNRIGVWFDQDMQRWTMDIVRPHGKRDSALAEASAAGVDHAYDVSNGFQRMVWDDDPLGNWRPAMKDPLDLKKRRSGTGTISVRTLDGKRREATHVFGPDVVNGNMFVEGMKADNAVEGYFGSGTRMGENLRSAGMTGDYQTIEPGVARAAEGLKAVQPGEHLWADMTAEYANRMVRKDAVWRRMLQGQTDRQVLGWLKSSEGRLYRERMGIGAMRSPESFLDEKRMVLETQFPGRAMQERMRDTDVTADDVERLIAPDDRHAIHGESIKQLAGENFAAKAWNNFVQKSYSLLGSKMSNAVTRHPMGAAMYRMKLQNLVAEYTDKQLTNSVMQGLQAQARAWSLKQVRKYMFDMTDEFNGVRAFRFVAPFFNAQIEVIERYLKLIGEHPDALGKLFGVANATGGDHGPFMHTVDAEGNATDGWVSDGYVTTQIPMEIAGKLPYFNKLQKVYKDVPIPTSSINLVLQGGEGGFGKASYFIPSMGPLVTIPVAEIAKRHLGPEHYTDAWFKQLFPYSMPKDVLDGVLPAWAKRVRTMIAEGDDPTYGTEAWYVLQSLTIDWEKGGRNGPQPEMADAKKYVDTMYALRAFAGLASPVSINPDTKYQFFIDRYRELMDKDPETAKEKFYNQYGPDVFRVTASTSRLNMDLPPNELAAAAWSEHHDLMEKSPLLAGVIAGPAAWNGEYNYDIYRWGLSQAVAPGSGTNIREKLSAEEILKQNNIDRGWIEYTKLSAAVDVELQRRGLVTLQAVQQKALETTGTTDPEAMEAAKESLLDAALNTNMAADLRAWRHNEIAGIAQRNSGWEDAYNSRSTEMGEWIIQAREVVADPSLDSRVDIQGLREYLNVRDQFTTELMRREQAGGSGSLLAEDNADLGVAWYTFTRKLVNTNLLFGEVFHRYLEDDDLSMGRF